MRGVMAKQPPGTFTFRVLRNGTLKKIPDDPWNVGSPDRTITIELDNTRHHLPHTVDIPTFKDPQGGAQPPFAPPYRQTTAPPWELKSSKHTVLNHGPGYYGAYVYKPVFDGVAVSDPEIIVEPPGFVPRGKPKPKPRPRKKTAAAKKASAKKSKAARRTTARKTSASATKRATKAKKAKKSRKAKKR